jgi:PKHD-type hydroxylase
MKHQYWTWVEELDDYMIDHIINIGSNEKQHNGTLAGIDNELSVDNKIRESKVSFIRDKEIDELIWKYVNEANNQAFGFDINNGFDVQYTRYLGKDKGFYTWHSDNDYTRDSFIDRKLSIVIQLTDPSEYEGGSFEFKFGKVEGFDKKGSVLVFPSFLEHRVNPITKGERNSLVSWIEGPHFR